MPANTDRKRPGEPLSIHAATWNRLTDDSNRDIIRRRQLDRPTRHMRCILTYAASQQIVPTGYRMRPNTPVDVDISSNVVAVVPADRKIAPINAHHTTIESAKMLSGVALTGGKFGDEIQVQTHGVAFVRAVATSDSSQKFLRPLLMTDPQHLEAMGYASWGYHTVLDTTADGAFVMLNTGNPFTTFRVTHTSYQLGNKAKFGPDEFYEQPMYLSPTLGYYEPSTQLPNQAGLMYTITHKTYLDWCEVEDKGTAVFAVWGGGWIKKFQTVGVPEPKAAW